MENAELLQSKLGNIERGARGFRVLAIVLLVLGCIGIGGGALVLLLLLRPGADWSAVLGDATRTVYGSLHYLLLAWLARRSADAFHAVAALIRELGEIV